jgi:hypothetical protein
VGGGYGWGAGGGQGAQKENRRSPWWVGGSEAKKGPGQIYFLWYFFMAFLNSPHRETPKNVIKKIAKQSVLDFPPIFLQKLFDAICFVKRFFCSAFELPSLIAEKHPKTR